MSLPDPSLERTAASLEWLRLRLPTLVPGARPQGAQAPLGKPAGAAADLHAALAELCAAMGLSAPHWSRTAEASSLPLLAIHPQQGVGVVFAEAGPDQWLVQTEHGTQRVARGLPDACYAPLRVEIAPASSSTGSARQLFRQVLAEQRPAFGLAALASLVASIVALASSMYSMQIYDRVIPTQGLSTLAVLTTGALLACAFELMVKLARAGILESAVQRMDERLSHAIFSRLLALRLDQLPASTGSMSAQVRSYESIRAFATSATLYVVVDAPFGLIFLAVMAMLAGPVLVAVPVISLVIALATGGLFRARIAAHARSASAAGNRKAGLLIETIENAENIKAAGLGWVQAAKWNLLSRRSLEDELKIRHYSETAAFLSGSVQQASYIAMIGVGAYLAATTSELTTGGLVACSILAGRVFGPIGMLPGLIVQGAHARIALDNLERIFALEQDNHGVARPLLPPSLPGALRVEDLRFAYPEQPPTVTLARLQIAAGEKVAIIGPVGAGKSTLLKIMAGLYKPQQGRVLIDGLEIQQVAREHLSARLGYLPQDVRLMAGTLRDNLGGGLPDVDDETMLEACRATGLIGLVCGHPKGLDLEIGEGGSGVSGGQRRQISLTRLVLARPSLWLLDEPTSSLDDASERQGLMLLQRAMRPGQTLVLVTHKPQMLALVDRIIVLTREGIVMDGPRDSVLATLGQNGRAQPAAAPSPASQAQASPATSAARPTALPAAFGAAIAPLDARSPSTSAPPPSHPRHDLETVA